MPPKLLNKKSCRGCGSNDHKTACCPNKPCPCCGQYHSRGILDCPITKAVLARQAAAKLLAEKAAASARRLASRLEAKVSRDAAAAAQNAVYAALVPFGVVVRNRTLYTKRNWAVVEDNTCPRCGWLPKGCFCV